MYTTQGSKTLGETLYVVIKGEHGKLNTMWSKPLWY